MSRPKVSHQSGFYRGHETFGEATLLQLSPTPEDTWVFEEAIVATVGIGKLTGKLQTGDRICIVELTSGLLFKKFRQDIETQTSKVTFEESLNNWLAILNQLGLDQRL